MEFTERGQGTALLLIHGFPLDRTTWDAQVDLLSRSCRVFAPDLRGLGKSPLPPGPCSMDDYARDLLTLMDQRGVARFAAAGHSMGGYVLFALHRIAPERLSGAALVSTRAKADPDDARKTREETAQRAEREGPGFLAEGMPERLLGPAPSPAIVEKLRTIIRATSGAGVAAASRAMAARPDATLQLPRLAVPTVVLAGRNDKVVPPAESEAMARSIPGARLVWCERSGHMPMMEEPDLVTRELSLLCRDAR